MPHEPDPETIARLAKVVDAISARGDESWWPGTEVAPVAYRRWRSIRRRNAAKEISHADRIADLVKGLQQRFEPNVPYTHLGDWLSLVEPLAAVLDEECPES